MTDSGSTPRVNYTRGTIALLALMITGPVLLARGPEHLILPPEVLVNLARYAMLPFESVILRAPSPYLAESIIFGFCLPAIVSPLLWSQFTMSFTAKLNAGGLDVGAEIRRAMKALAFFYAMRFLVIVLRSDPLSVSTDTGLILYSTAQALVPVAMYAVTVMVIIILLKIAALLRLRIN